MKRIRIIALCLLAAFATAAAAAATASAELPEYAVCGKAAKIEGTWRGHYTSSACTEASKVETGGEYELEKGFGKKATFTAKGGESVVASAEVPRTMECKTTSATGNSRAAKT